MNTKALIFLKPHTNTRMKKYFTLYCFSCLILFFTVACQDTQTDQVVRYLSEEVTLDLADSTVIPFEYCQGMIIFKVQVDQQEYPFVLDPHATTSPFSFDLVEKLNLPLKEVSKKFQVTRFKTIKIGKAVFKEVGLLVPKTIETQEFLTTCFSVAGVIGANVMQYGAWQIDYQNQKIIIKPNLPKQETTPFWGLKKDAAKRVSAILNLNGKRELWVRMGMNNKNAMSLPAQFFHETRTTVNYRNVEKSLLFNTESQSIDTLYSAWVDSVYSYNLLFGKKTFWTDHQTWKNQRIDFSSQLSLKEGGVVNNGFWENHMVWWSAPQEIIYTESKPYQENYLHELIFSAYGLKLGLHNGKVIVMRLQENSIADKSGIKLREEITQIDDHVFKQAQDFCRFVQIQQPCAKTMKVVTATKVIDLTK